MDKKRKLQIVWSITLIILGLTMFSVLTCFISHGQKQVVFGYTSAILFGILMVCQCVIDRLTKS